MSSGRRWKRAIWTLSLACCALSTASCRPSREEAAPGPILDRDRVFRVEKQPDGRYAVVGASGARSPEEIEKVKATAPEKAYLLTEERLLKLYYQNLSAAGSGGAK